MMHSELNVLENVEDGISPDRKDAFRRFVLSAKRTVSPTMFGMFSMDQDLMNSCDSISQPNISTNLFSSAGATTSNFSWSINHLSSIYGQQFENIHEIDLFHDTEDSEVTNFLDSQSVNFFSQDEIIASPQDRQGELTLSQTSIRRNTEEFVSYLHSIKDEVDSTADLTVSMRNQDYLEDSDKNFDESDSYNNSKVVQMSVDLSCQELGHKKYFSQECVSDSDYASANTMELGCTTPNQSVDRFIRRKTPSKWPRMLFDFSHLSPIGRRTPFANHNNGFPVTTVKRCSNLYNSVDHGFPDISPIVEKFAKSSQQIKSSSSSMTPKGFTDPCDCSPIAKINATECQNSMFKTPVSSSRRSGNCLNRTKLFSQEVTSTPN